MKETKEQQTLAEQMEKLEDILQSLDLDRLRGAVTAGDLLDSGDFRLPTGNTFMNHHKQARLWLAFIDDWKILRREMEEIIQQSKQ